MNITMSKTIDFYFDLGSPTAYLAYIQLKKYAEQYAAQINYKPILLGAVMKATNNIPPAMVKNKGRYMLKHDMPRYIRRYGVPFQMNSHFPINTLPVMRGCIAAEQLGCFDAYLELMFNAVWVDNKNLNDLAVIQETLSGAGMDVAQFLSLVSDDKVKQTLKDTTEEAIERGVFGAPTMFIGDEMYFGQDRLDFIEAELSI